MLRQDAQPFTANPYNIHVRRIACDTRRTPLRSRGCFQVNCGFGHVASMVAVIESRAQCVTE